MSLELLKSLWDAMNVKVDRAAGAVIVPVEQFEGLQDQLLDVLQDFYNERRRTNGPGLTPELLVWRQIELHGIPDSDESVLGYNAEWSTPTALCYHDGDGWRSQESFTLDGSGPDLQEPTAWAKWPEGPAK